MLQMSELACRRGDHCLFEPLTVQLSDGECMELSGANGAGKTTLLRTLAGIHQQFDGEFSVASFIYQGHRLGLDGLLNALENLTWYGHLLGRDVHTDELQAALRRVDMLAHAYTPVGQLSQGQQRRVAMAKWLLADVRVWLLDEPLMALDSDGQTLLAGMLGAHCEAGGIAFCATHVGLAVAGSRTLKLQPNSQSQSLMV